MTTTNRALSLIKRHNTLTVTDESRDPRDDVSKECHDYIKTKVNRLLKMYPAKMKKWLKVGYTFSTTSEFDGFDNELRFSSYGLGGTLKEANKAIDFGTGKDFGVGSGLLALIVHEFGHAVNQFIVQMAKGDDALQDEWFAAKKALLKTLPHPSKYSKTNDREHFAELYVLETVYEGKAELHELIEVFLGKLIEAGHV
jgi:hypothetical protein